MLVDVVSFKHTVAHLRKHAPVFKNGLQHMDHLEDASENADKALRDVDDVEEDLQASEDAILSGLAPEEDDTASSIADTSMSILQKMSEDKSLGGFFTSLFESPPLLQEEEDEEEKSAAAAAAKGGGGSSGGMKNQIPILPSLPAASSASEKGPEIVIEIPS